MSEKKPTYALYNLVVQPTETKISLNAAKEVSSITNDAQKPFKVTITEREALCAMYLGLGASLGEIERYTNIGRHQVTSARADISAKLSNTLGRTTACEFTSFSQSLLRECTTQEGAIRPLPQRKLATLADVDAASTKMSTLLLKTKLIDDKFKEGLQAYAITGEIKAIREVLGISDSAISRRLSEFVNSYLGLTINREVLTGLCANSGLARGLRATLVSIDRQEGDFVIKQNDEWAALNAPKPFTPRPSVVVLGDLCDNSRGLAGRGGRNNLGW